MLIVVYLVRKFWLLFVILFVVFVFILSVVCYVFLYVEYKKYLIEDYINECYGVSFSIGSVYVVW